MKNFLVWLSKAKTPLGLIALFVVSVVIIVVLCRFSTSIVSLVSALKSIMKSVWCWFITILTTIKSMVSKFLDKNKNFTLIWIGLLTLSVCIFFFCKNTNGMVKSLYNYTILEVPVFIGG